ncbi:SIMPL domain-containing protein [Alkalicoccobacillus gibsonii]|uniref:SIMPL domain-containing protein n=1 Tax=Alkalicoccobacillus gibsonii TaxID=79881 RepID=UPI0019330534|nr:SIMPL domain-containing protein [Alkalicoccobacillus gibsonii]MBM0067599.1 SIMPL domain-containing protein [Alkalicoccobacillus gibsonii]
MSQAEQTIKVQGEAILSVRPDQLSITLGVKTENQTVQQAQTENADAIQAIIHSLMSLGIPGDQIQTVVYQIDPQYDYVDGTQVFRAHLVTHLLEITVNDLTLAGTIIDQAVANGANSISGTQFTLANTSGATLQALDQAMNDAYQKAQAISRTLSVSLNPLPVWVREVPVNEAGVVRPLALFDATQQTSIQPGLIDIKAVVEVLFKYG